ncbi:MAG: hypothetical protein HYV06_03245 [Deltaproteobacteria bacterium]|nr:hypothetical protein [Deltaproteobacteria bacterium]
MYEQRQRLTNGGKSAFLLAVLIAAGFAGNFFAPRLFGGFNYLFGSIAVLMVVCIYGMRWGVVAALIASSWTLHLFGHPYAMIPLAGEALFVGFLLGKGRSRNIILYVTMYWPLIGAPILGFFFLAVMRVPLTGTLAATLMYWIIGITNSLIASLLLNYVPSISAMWHPQGSRPTIAVRHLIFNLLISIVLIPAIIIMVLHGRDIERKYLHELGNHLGNTTETVSYEIRLKLLRGRTSRSRPTDGADAGELQALRDIINSSRYKPYHHVTLLDSGKRVIVSTRPELKEREPYEPGKRGEMKPTGGKDIFHLMLAASGGHLPLWQRIGRSFYLKQAPLGGEAPWTVLVEAPFAPYQQKIFAEHIRALTSLLALNLLVLCMSVYISRKLAAPIRRLSVFTTDLPGKISAQQISGWPQSSIDEIDQLIANFQEMAAALHQKFEQISFANETLEQRVEERTRELTWINEELQTEIAEHRLTARQRDLLMNELEQKNKELEGIVHVASHDLRSPLVNAQGFSRKLARSCAELDRIVSGLEMDKQQRVQLEPILREGIPKALGFITGSIEKMDALLNGLLRLSRLGRAALCFENLDMRVNLTKIVSSMTCQIEAAGARVELGHLDPCVADGVQVTQIFSNLLDNALKYRSPLRPLVVRVFSEKTDSGVRYCVEDNGIGIPPGQQERIWEIFHRLNPDDSQGEGLGLTTARRIVDRLGGSIRVESEGGSGSRFYVQLPNTPGS